MAPRNSAEYWSRAGNTRHIALAWLRGEDRYQFRKFSLAASHVALDDGVRDSIWGSELGNYPLRAAVFYENDAPLQALQAAGKSAAVARALYAVAYQLHRPHLSIEDASEFTLSDLELSVPRAIESDPFDYLGVRDIHTSPLWEKVSIFDETLPRPVAHGDVNPEHVNNAREICLAGVDLFMDYVVEIAPYGTDTDWPQPGHPSGTIVPWRPLG
jgi:hypothetical protein